MTLTEKQYQTLVRIVAEAYKQQREVKKDGKGKSSTNRSNIYE